MTEVTQPGFTLQVFRLKILVFSKQGQVSLLSSQYVP